MIHQSRAPMDLLWITSLWQLSRVWLKRHRFSFAVLATLVLTFLVRYTADIRWTEEVKQTRFMPSPTFSTASSGQHKRTHQSVALLTLGDILLIIRPVIVPVSSCHHAASQAWNIFTCESPQIAKLIGPTWGPPGSCRPPMSPMLAPGNLLPG